MVEIGKRLVYPLSKVARRIKEKMPKSEYFMMVAMMALPTGIIIYLQFEKIEIVGIFLMATAMFAWLAGIFSLNREEKQRNADRDVTNNLIREGEHLATTIISELKGFRADMKELTDEIRKDRNGRNNSDKRDSTNL